MAREPIRDRTDAPPRGRCFPLLLLLATILADAALCEGVRGRRFPSTGAMLVLGLALSQAGLSGLYLVLGTAHCLWRTAVVVVTIVAWTRASDLFQLDLTLGGPLCLQAAIVGLGALPLRAAAVEWSGAPVRDATASAAGGEPMQFTVTGLLSWTAAAAVLTAVARQYLNFPPPGQRIESGAVLLAGAVAILGGAYVASTWRYALAGLAVISLLIALVLWSAMPFPSRVGAGAYGALCGFEAIASLLLVAAARAGGFALRRRGAGPSRAGDHR